MRVGWVLKTVGCLVLGASVWLEALAAMPKAKVCREGACFSSRQAIGGTEVPLKGTALLEYLFFDVYSAAFYAEPSIDSSEEALASGRKAIVVQYHRRLEREEFIKSTEELLQNNPTVEVKEIRDELQQLYRMYRDVEAGDRYVAEYVTGHGTTLRLNGMKQGTIPGEKFQRAYFGIWLSRYSVNQEFTEQLLGKEST